MPYQSASSLLVIIGAFNAIGALCWGVDRLYYGVRQAWRTTSLHYFILGRIVARTENVVFDVSLFIISLRLLTNVFMIELSVYLFARAQRRGRPMGRDRFSFALEKRDERIDAYRKYMATKKWSRIIFKVIVRPYAGIFTFEENFTRKWSSPEHARASVDCCIA